jgi:hypothetical protein
MASRIKHQNLSLRSCRREAPKSAATRKTKLGLYSRRGVDKWIVDWPLRKIDLYRLGKTGMELSAPSASRSLDLAPPARLHT